MHSALISSTQFPLLTCWYRTYVSIPKLGLNKHCRRFQVWITFFSSFLCQGAAVPYGTLHDVHPMRHTGMGILHGNTAGMTLFIIHVVAQVILAVL